MPGMTGLQALQQIMTKNPVPVIMVSSVTVEGAQETLQALEWGAVDFIPNNWTAWPRKSPRSKILVPKVLAARYAGSKLKRLNVTGAPKLAVPAAKALSSRSVSVTRGTKLIAIGCSTGGPQAFLKSRRSPPIVRPASSSCSTCRVVPKPFAERLNNLCALEVREAVDGDEVKPGRVLVAPGGMQFRVVKKTITTSVVKLAPNYEKACHSPSVDIMLQSVAALFGTQHRSDFDGNGA